PQLLMYVLQPSPRIVSFLESVRQQACENGLELLTFDFHGEEGRRRFLELLTDPARREAFMKIYDLYVPTAGYAVEMPEPWPVNLDFTARHLRVGTSVTTLEPLLLAIYAGFLSNKRSCSETSCRAEHGDCAFRCFLSIADMCRNGFPHRVAEFYRRSYGWGGQREEDMLARLENGLETEAMRQYISKINRRLRASLCDHPMLDRLLIVPIGRYGNTRYGVRLPRHAVPKE
ncbi:MAG TPA: hypothetical protein PKO06_05545, partial [Candidatus Ozemobacteraceae bacterium]|nr:hypothetical protein [Candidatus Ozemobacteraceae bacterium]